MLDGLKSRWAWIVPAACLSLVWPGYAEEPQESSQLSLTDLSMEVVALETLRSFMVTRAQMEQLRTLAKELTDRPPGPAFSLRARGARGGETTKGSDKLRNLLIELHQALIKDDQERIEELGEKLEDFHDTGKPVLDDDIEITDEARELAPQAARVLTPAQVALWLGSNAESIPEPCEVLLEALRNVRSLDAKEWKALRDGISDEMARLLAGVDQDKAIRVNEKVVQLLIVARGLKEQEFKKQSSELAEKARAIVGDIGPTDVLRNVLEHHLAELLSNPRLVPVLEMRLK